MVSIIDYRAGNLRSVERALKKIGVKCLVTSDRKAVCSADRIIFPGVGAAGQAMLNLKELGLDSVISQAFREGKPILGICLGAQIVLEKSEENDSTCIGILKGLTRRFPQGLADVSGRLKIPHMGWNGFTLKKKHPVLEGLGPSDEFYFVHSYYPSPDARECIIGTTEYGISFPSVIGSKNIIAMQFHPEKSGPPGLRILENFCRWNGNA